MCVSKKNAFKIKIRNDHENEGWCWIFLFKTTFRWFSFWRKVDFMSMVSLETTHGQDHWDPVDHCFFLQNVGHTCQETICASNSDLLHGWGNWFMNRSKRFKLIVFRCVFLGWCSMNNSKNGAWNITFWDDFVNFFPGRDLRWTWDTCTTIATWCPFGAGFCWSLLRPSCTKATQIYTVDFTVIVINCLQSSVSLHNYMWFKMTFMVILSQIHAEQVREDLILEALTCWFIRLCFPRFLTSKDLKKQLTS